MGADLEIVRHSVQVTAPVRTISVPARFVYNLFLIQAYWREFFIMEPWMRAHIVVPDHVADCLDAELDSYHFPKEWAPHGSIRSHFWFSKPPIPMDSLAQYFEEMKSSCFHYLQRYAVDKGSNELLFRIVISFSGMDFQTSFQSIIQSEFISVSFSMGNCEIKFSILSCKLIAELQEWMATFNSSLQTTILGLSMDCKTLHSHVKRTQNDPSDDLRFNRVHAMRLGGAIPISTSFQENCRLVNIARGAVRQASFLMNAITRWHSTDPPYFFDTIQISQLTDATDCNQLCGLFAVLLTDWQ